MTDTPWIGVALLAFAAVLFIGAFRNVKANDVPTYTEPEPEPLIPGPCGYRVWGDGGYWYHEIVNGADQPLERSWFGYSTEAYATAAAIRTANHHNRARAAERAREAATVVRGQA